MNWLQKTAQPADAFTLEWDSNASHYVVSPQDASKLLSYEESDPKTLAFINQYLPEMKIPWQRVAKKKNWLRKISQTKPLIFWHATIPRYAEQIKERGEIVPLLTLEDEGQSPGGWNYEKKEGEYGDGVYLARAVDLSLYYANLRLKQEREHADLYTEMDLYDEDIEYLGLFKVYVMAVDKLLETGKGEVKYRGIIGNKPNSEAWFEWVHWVSRSRDTSAWRQQIEGLHDEYPMQGENNEKDDFVGNT